MPSNSAAWLKAPFVPLTVADAPTAPPEAGQIQVRNHAVAINPVDRFQAEDGANPALWLAENIR